MIRPEGLRTLISVALLGLSIGGFIIGMRLTGPMPMVGGTLALYSGIIGFMNMIDLFS